MPVPKNHEQRTSSVSSRVGLGVFAVTVGVYAFYAWFLISNLPSIPIEGPSIGEHGGVAFSTFRRFLTFTFDVDLFPTRYFSLGCGLAAIALTFRVGVVLSKDYVAGAFLAFGYILFPPLVALFSLATSHAFISLLGVLAIAVMVEPRSPLGFHSRVATAGASLCMAVILTVSALPFTDIVSAGNNSVFEAAFFPFAMLWVGISLSIFALRNRNVRNHLGPLGIKLVSAAPVFGVVFCIVEFFAGGRSNQELMSGVANVFGLLLVGVLPLILWVRFEMPKVRSVVAWIAFPVIMYCGFWMVLGPIQRESFPYSVLHVPSGEISDSASEPVP